MFVFTVLLVMRVALTSASASASASLLLKLHTQYPLLLFFSSLLLPSSPLYCIFFPMLRRFLLRWGWYGLEKWAWYGWDGVKMAELRYGDGMEWYGHGVLLFACFSCLVFEVIAAQCLRRCVCVD
ncbi:hypothetical protein EJ08DRAFT_323460 [Tothia fuscella]|uniref:Uncharacterized protein n=1 Tax=Tothia fuscella TaxID=1048955 RepID=A0A9P4NNB8_9PEZI|nr:hypothetical protein EJ08DRAFT_323460 [Tothia fuscella]